jgi:hypothetical protein
MPQFWQIDATRWINPAHIVYVEDSPDSSLPSLYMTMVAVTSGLRRTGQRNNPGTEGGVEGSIPRVSGARDGVRSTPYV